MVALSAIEVEFIICTEAIKVSLWLKGITRQLMVANEDTAGVVLCDNHSIIHLSKHCVFHNRSKYIDLKYHFIINVVTQCLVNIDKVAIKDNLVTILTKILLTTKFYHCMNLVKVKITKYVFVVGKKEKPTLPLCQGGEL